jgi:hypothetical protein
MFSETNWRIQSWNGESFSISLGVGLSGGTLELGLSHGSETHHLQCVGLGGSLGIGGEIGGGTPSASSLGFETPSRTQYGTLYKNDLTVEGELTFDLLRTSTITVTGVELPILDEGQSAYVVLFASGSATVASILAGAGGLLSFVVSGATCRAITFVGAPARGIPGAAFAGYRYRVEGGH